MKRIILIILFLFSFSTSHVASSATTESLRLNEIMYSPVGGDPEEWIELYNPGEIEVKIIGGAEKGAWIIIDASGPHFLANLALQGDLDLAPKEYLIIANDAELFLKKYPEFTGAVTDSTLNLANDFGYLQIKNGLGTTVSQAVWSFHLGADRNNRSLEFNQGIFRESIRDGGTPGEKNSLEGLSLPPAPSPIVPSPTPQINPETPVTQQKTGKISLNEIFYSPGKNNQPWVELKNNENKTINLDGWKIIEVLTKRETLLSGVITGNSLIVIELPGLNRKSEALQLFDSNHKKVFEVKYSSEIPRDWAAARFENSTWKITARSTPGKENIYFIPQEIKETFVPQELVPMINFENATSPPNYEVPTAGLSSKTLVFRGLFISSLLSLGFVLIKKKNLF